MGFFRRSDRKHSPAGDERGVALFMVLAAVAILSLLVAEFTYIAKLNQKLAYDAADQLKAHYLAKSALKISLLRLKAYQNVKTYIAGATQGGGGNLVPKGVIEKIWSFPFLFPLPTEIPGLSPIQKAGISKFQAASSLDGNFTALIESESSKYNLNMILAPFAAAAKDEKPKEDTKSGGSGANKDTDGDGEPDTEDDDDDGDGIPDDEDPQPLVAAATPFNSEKARESLASFVKQIFQNKLESDEAFEDQYGNFELDTLIDSIVAWSDRKFEPASPINDHELKLKQAPFYSVSELHMVPYMDDKLYDLLAPNFTASPTPGVNVNTIRKEMLKALIPEITDDESKEFFEFRDSTKEDNLFKQPDDFFTYLQNNIGHFNNSSAAVQDFKKSLTDRSIRIVTDETEFRIEVNAQVNSSVRMIEAWVTLKKPKSSNTGAAGSGNSGGAGGSVGGIGVGGAGNPIWQGAAVKRPDSGLKITFMRIY